MDKNISVNQQAYESAVAQIQREVADNLITKRDEYDSLLSLFSASACDHTTAMRELLQKEKKLVDDIILYFTKTVEMIEKAAADIERVEKHYSTFHIQK